MKRIDFEAHFTTQDFVEAMYQNKGRFPRFEDDPVKGRELWYNPDVRQPFVTPFLKKLLDLGEERLREMDECGVDVQVLSLAAPGVEQFDIKVGTELARKSNDQLYAAVQKYPDRFMGFAALAPNDPEAAAAELERCVKELGFIGWNTHSTYGATKIDDPKYIPILEKAEELGVPVYIHPTIADIAELKGYGFSLAGAPFGFGVDAATCAMRFLYSGIFDRCPKLKVILGHLGEGLPFIYKRIDWAFLRPFDLDLKPVLKKKPSEYLTENFYITSSGQFNVPSFICSIDSLGIDRLLLGSDYPFEDLKESTDFMKALPVSNDHMEKIMNQNGKSLLGN